MENEKRLYKIEKVFVRVTLDSNLFHLTEGLFKRVLPLYYTVIAWDGTDTFNHLLARKYFITVQLRSLLFFGLDCFRNAIFKCTQMNLLVTF